jgi:nicotinamide mononucleotide adenylyltransferase
MALRWAAIAAVVSVSRSQEVIVSWNNVVRQLQTEASLQVVVNPLIVRGSPIHDQVYASLANLRANHVRFVPW